MSSWQKRVETILKKNQTEIIELKKVLYEMKISWMGSVVEWRWEA